MRSSVVAITFPIVRSTELMALCHDANTARRLDVVGSSARAASIVSTGSGLPSHTKADLTIRLQSSNDASAGSALGHPPALKRQRDFVPCKRMAKSITRCPTIRGSVAAEPSLQRRRAADLTGKEWPHGISIRDSQSATDSGHNQLPIAEASNAFEEMIRVPRPPLLT